jgi:phosphohistidine swiveling domain-containing protein
MIPAARSAARWILDRVAAQSAPVDRIGGKAAGLANLERAGARVPPWFVVTAEAFAAHLAQGELEATIDRELIQLTMETVDAASQRLRAAVEAQALPPALRMALIQSLPTILPGPWAVRSSMVGEDAAERSFAGQLDTLLYQQNADDVAAALVRCWSSAFTARALAYQLRAGVLTRPAVGVIVQRMISGRVSGVMFTAHPTTGRREHVLITANWGQGEGVVSGACNTDEITVAHDGTEVAATIAHKDTQILRAPAGRGTEEQPVPEAQRDVRCLAATEAASLAAEGVRLARAFGAPQDIEWTLDGDKIFLLQARPITALPEPENTDGPVVVWDNSNIQESYCGVTTPLTFSFAASAYASVYEQLLRVLSLPPARIEAYRPTLRHMLGLIRGRVYYNINNWYRVLLILPGFGRNKQDMEKMMGLDSPVDFIEDTRLTLAQKIARVPRLLLTLLRMKGHFRSIDRAVAQFLADFEAAYRRIDRREFRTATFSRLMEIREQLKREMLGNWHTPIVNDFYVMMSTGRLRRLVEKTMGVEAPRLLPNLMCGEEGIESTEPTRFLMRLAKQARALPALAAVLREGRPLDALARVRMEHPEFAARLDEYIERYGDRCIGELKLETISLREDPSFLVHALRNYLERPDLDPDRLAARERELRNEAEREINARLGWRGRQKLAAALRHARKAVKYRENMRLARTRGFGLYRDLHLGLGARLAEAGRLDHARDIFYVTVEEIDGFFDGTATAADLRALAAARKAEFASHEKMELPHRFETRGPVHMGNRYTPPTPAVVDTSARLLRGTGCYPGVVEAPARVILSPHDDLSLNGRILVTLRTDPGWAPLFPSSSGILVERGSTLSHSAILARELGIPAIVGVPNLLKIVRDGERLRLDGGAGTVERMEP